jgi:hypothetical protein
MKLARDKTDALIYGSPGTSRFTQDSPVLPDVWIRYLEEPDRQHELLLTPYQDPNRGRAGPGLLAMELQEALGIAPGRPTVQGGTSPQIAYNLTTVVTRLWFTELIRVALPRSVWWRERLGPRAAALLAQLRESARRAVLIDALLNPLRARDEQFGLSPDILWMAQVIGTIEYARTHEVPGSDWPPLGDEGRRAPERQRLEQYYRDIVDALAGLTRDLVVPEAPRALVWQVTLNRRAQSTVHRSRTTVKADAATRVFGVSCQDLAWAVLDSGIDATHPAFNKRDAGGKPQRPFESGQNNTRVIASYDFTLVRYLLSPTTPLVELPERLQARLVDPVVEKQRTILCSRLLTGGDIDWDLLTPLIQIPHEAGVYQPPVNEHGTHVAGILAADWPERTELGPQGLQGICPDLHLYDLRVLDHRGEGDEFSVMAALQFVRHMNSHREAAVVHGVNISVSIRHDVANFACGRTPVCEECERLVGAGIIVVAAAGNDGYLQYLTSRGPQDSYRSISITDPGNADGVITVGSTHRFQPHTYGVSYFSSRGPTGDGRAKPDLVAPGEKIEAPVPGSDLKRMDGTSMAAPHVSGAAALLVARHRELIGQPARVKRILCSTATDLGRERYFQGAGMVDVLRAIQSV